MLTWHPYPATISELFFVVAENRKSEGNWRSIGVQMLPQFSCQWAYWKAATLISVLNEECMFLCVCACVFRKRAEWYEMLRKPMEQFSFASSVLPLWMMCPLFDSRGHITHSSQRATSSLRNHCGWRSLWRLSHTHIDISLFNQDAAPESNLSHAVIVIPVCLLLLHSITVEYTWFGLYSYIIPPSQEQNTKEKKQYLPRIVNY